MAIDPIVAGLEASRLFLTAIEELVKAQILSSFIDKIPGVDAVGRAIDSRLAQAETEITKAENAIKTQIEPLIQKAVPDAISFLSSLTQTLDSHLTQLLGNIATTEDVIGTAINELRKQAQPLARWIFQEVSGGLGATALNVLKEMEGQEPDGINAVLDHLLSLPNQPAYFKTLTEGFRNRGAEWQALALPALLVGILVGATEAMQEPFQVAIRQGSFDQMPTREADPPTLIESLIRRNITDERFEHGMRQNGFQSDISGMMLNARTPLLDPDTVTRLYLRGEVDQVRWESELVRRGFDTDRARLQWLASLQLVPPDDIRSAFLRGIYSTEAHDHALGQHGFTSDQAQLLRQLYFYIPPVPDIIHMGIRNVFNPEIVERFNLLGDYPAAFEKAAAQQGVSKDWAEKYWEAHWIVPGRSEAFEMFQRTTDHKLDEHADVITLSDGTQVYNIIGRDTLNLLLREVDTPPFYRDKITQVAYRPLTRIDIRRLNKIGLLPHAGVERAYLDLGYTQAHARLLADFTEQLNATATKDQASALTTSLRRKVLNLYIADKLGADDVKQTMLDLGFSDAEITVFIAEADLDRQAEYVAAVEAGIGKLYVAGMISDKDAIQRLQDSGVPVDAQTALFAKWDLAIEFRGGTEHIIKHRELTKTEVLDSFVEGMMDQTTAENMLEALGYDQASADAEINLALYKQLKAVRRTQTDAIKAMYVNGTRELLDTSNALDQMNVTPDQRDGYLAEWTLARETRTERIPIATIRDMVRKNGFMSDADAFAHLKRHRFTDDDANLLLRWWHGA